MRIVVFAILLSWLCVCEPLQLQPKGIAKSLKVPLNRQMVVSTVVGTIGALWTSTANAGFLEDLSDSSRKTFDSRVSEVASKQSEDGAAVESSELIQSLLKKTEENKDIRKRMLQIEMFEKSQSGLYGPGRKNFAIVDETGQFKIISEFEFARLKKEGRLTEDRQLLPEKS